MKVLIAGAGIGGLVTALKLHQLGVEVEVFESVKEIKPLGVGINLLPHSIRVLTNMGLQEKIAKIAVETSSLEYFNRYGQRFWAEPRGKLAGYRWPQFSIHRGAFQMLLFHEVERTIGKIKVSHHLSEFSQNEHEVVAKFVNRETEEAVFEAKGDVLIGADGINSVVRKQLFPAEGPPVYSENVLYRGTTRMKGYLDGRTMAMIGSLRQKMVVYPIDNTPDTDGNVLVNWVGNLKEGQSKLTARDWNRQADQGRLIDLYKNWSFDWLDVPKMIAEAPAVFEFPMSDRDPLDRWTHGRVTLLGDAAHPMYPIGSNGASQAILDADDLTEAISQNTDIKTALVQYDAQRVPAAAKVVLQNRAKGPDEIMDLMEDWFPQGFAQEQIPHDKLATIMDNYKKVAGFDVQTLNQKP